MLRGIVRAVERLRIKHRNRVSYMSASQVLAAFVETCEYLKRLFQKFVRFSAIPSVTHHCPLIFRKRRKATCN